MHGGHRNLASRISGFGLGAVLVFLSGFALWSAIRSEDAASQLRRSRLLTNAYQQARFAMDDERLLEHEYLIGHGGNFVMGASTAIHKRFDAIAARVDSGLANIRRLGDPADRALGNQLISEQRNYHTSTDAQFTAAQMGNGQMAHAQGMNADRLFVPLRDRMTAVSNSHNAKALTDLTSLETTERNIRSATLVVIPLALLLFAGFAVLLRGYRRREAEVTRREMARLERDAFIDSLTGLRNHRAFEEDLDREIARADRSGEPLSLVLIDLDALKHVNDRLGHQVGDERLKALSDSLTRAIRGGDGAYRVGGDEFALILAGARSWGALEAAQRARESLPELASTREKALASRASVNGSLMRQTATAGIAEAGPGVSRDELIRKADTALLTAKRTHRGVLIYSPEMDRDGSADDVHATRMDLAPIASALARAVDAKDSLTRSHSETVAETCVLIGIKLGLAADRLAKLRIAGLLHDVGKIGIPDAVLNKPGPLTVAEYAVMKTHSILGHGIVEASGLAEEAGWILHHHERIDGGGYPDGLAGEAISLESRIILVADAFEAMTANRPYRPRRAEAEAISELRRNASTQFDPRCVEALEAVVTPTTAAPIKVA